MPDGPGLPDEFLADIAKLRGTKETQGANGEESPIAQNFSWLKDGKPHRIKQVNLANQPRRPAKPEKIEHTRAFMPPERTLELDMDETREIKPPPPPDSVVFEGEADPITLHALLAEGSGWSPLWTRVNTLTPAFIDYLTANAKSRQSDLLVANSYDCIFRAANSIPLLPRQLAANLALQTTLSLINRKSKPIWHDNEK
jgi:hypothetical protein